MRREEAVLSVSQLNGYIKSLMDGDAVLAEVAVRGELSNYKVYPSGHHYFSLKDAEGVLRCVMFRREAVGMRFRPENGMKVIAYGRVTVFPRDGQYQLYCGGMTPDGAGDLHVAFEQLKAKLQAEGLFDEGHKKPIPKFPARIALVTSPAGAAVRDMLRILGARWPMSKVAVVPVRVQGAEAPAEIAAAISWVNRYRCADLIITGRGGGSMEDLWAFNEEVVAKAIYASEIPVISAVGHEPDVTIADFVADLRAATPSNAAELAVPDQNDIYERLYRLSDRFSQATSRRLTRERQRLEYLSRSRALQSPLNYIQDRRVLLDYQRDRLAHGLTAALGRERARFARLAAALDAMSPLKVLGRGYAIAQKEDGDVVRSVKDVMPGERLVLRVSDGNIRITTET
ncbi:Exodeoxyribonuclease 7 large subunit [uncultured Eubacteriales bacterium]|uniref:Exodeoxyribonuclease 7 large subunit n=1 Tax=uncultured Eubacteriales bacterium TaxID=172733 RepID=A0A212JVQ1_9FIRM|nr:Exodeoxyribonuclease 7 large subunit [uncultured Eubacteriales bacterium]